MGPEKALIPSSKDNVQDLRAEGIDIVGPSVALDNEFSKPEEAYAQTGGTEAKQSVDSALQTPENQTATEKPAQKTQETEQVQTPVVEMSEGPHETSPIEPAPTIQNDPSIKALRTFKSDAEEAVRYGNMSKASIALAEQKKREKETPIEYVEEKHSSPGLYIALALAIVVALSGGWYYWFNSSQGEAPGGKIAAPTVVFKAAVPYSKTSVVVLDPSSDPMELIASKISASNGAVGTVTAVLPIASSTAASLVPISDVVDATHIPNRLLRSLSDDYMMGSYANGVQSPFLVVKDTFFQNAFSGMLEWEGSMREDFLPLIRVSWPDTPAEDASSTSFEDGVVSNVDVRSLKDSSGNVILAYAFANKDTIVITTTPTALKYLLDKMLEVRTIQ